MSDLVRIHIVGFSWCCGSYLYSSSNWLMSCTVTVQLYPHSWSVSLFSHIQKAGLFMTPLICHPICLYWMYFSKAGHIYWNFWCQTCLKRSTKQLTKLKTDGSLMQVKSIAECFLCSLGAFCNTLDLHKAIISLENIFLSSFDWKLNTGLTVRKF